VEELRPLEADGTAKPTMSSTLAQLLRCVRWKPWLTSETRSLVATGFLWPSTSLKTFGTHAISGQQQTCRLHGWPSRLEWTQSLWAINGSRAVLPCCSQSHQSSCTKSSMCSSIRSTRIPVASRREWSGLMSTISGFPSGGAFMIFNDPANNAAVSLGPWLHGSNASFSHWLVPPPSFFVDPFTVHHTAVFFTKHREFALAVGRNTCTAHLKSSAKVLVPEVSSNGSQQLRLALLKIPGISKCEWLSTPEIWQHSWYNGEVLRFSADLPTLTALTNIAAQALRNRLPTVSEQIIIEGAMNNITRGWIEAIVDQARALGFDAIQGHEIDRHSGGPKISRPWLAVMNSHVLSSPNWL
jgi:hypothetical protein